jgi:hypothetical protein
VVFRIFRYRKIILSGYQAMLHISTTTHSTTECFEPTAGNWVALRDLPSAYSFNEALLLCELPEVGWLAWVPDYGQMLLASSQFYRSL